MIGEQVPASTCKAHPRQREEHVPNMDQPVSGGITLQTQVNLSPSLESCYTPLPITYYRWEMFYNIVLQRQ